jgi:hypothetical protein
VSIFRRPPGPEQQAWLAIQARVRETLVERLATGVDAVLSEQDADFLADHVADDLMLLAPSIPPEHWISDPRG